MPYRALLLLHSSPDCQERHIAAALLCDILKDSHANQDNNIYFDNNDTVLFIGIQLGEPSGKKHTCCFASVKSLFVFLNFIKSLQQTQAAFMSDSVFLHN
jgi:hypothetical protein